MTYIGIIIAVKLRSKQSEISLIDIAAGILMTGILFSFLFQKKLLLRKSLVPHSAIFLVILFALWTSGISLLNIITDKTTVESWYREFLTFSPLIFIPILFNGVVEKNEGSLKLFVKFLLVLWFIEEIASVLLIKQSMHDAVFLYQTGRAVFDVLGSSVMIFIFLSLSSAESNIKKRKYYIIGILISIIGLLLTFNRTGWIMTIILVFVMLITTPKPLRKNRNSTIIPIFFILLIGTASLLLLFPIFQLIAKWATYKFITASNLKTDASLYNRYVEWRYVWQQILSTPISGVGFGGQFKDYVWITGNTVYSFYTHSGVLGILLKSGIVGLILLLTAYIRFFVIGCKLLFARALTDMERALVRAGLFVILLISLHSLTLNPFMHREILWYLGLVWAYYIYLEQKVKRSFELHKY